MTIKWPYIYLKLDSDLTDEAGNGFTISIDGTPDFSTKPSWLTLDGSTNAIRIEYSQEVRDLFTIGTNAGLFLIRMNMSVNNENNTLISAPGGNSGPGIEGTRIVIASPSGAMRTIANDEGTIVSNSEDVVDGLDNGMGFVFRPSENDYNQFIKTAIVTGPKGPYASGGRGQNSDLIASGIGFALPGFANPDVIIGARQRNDTSLDQFVTCAVQEFAFFNFDHDIPDNRKLGRMMRQYFTTGEFGSEWQ